MFLSPTNMTTGMSVTNNGTGAYGFMLDQFPGADVGLSLRRLSTAYNGPMMRIRRSIDDEEADLHFDARHYIWLLSRFSIKSPPASNFLEAGGLFLSHKASRSPV